MKNNFINKFKSKIKLNIKGKNIDRFIRRIIKNKIEIINLKKVNDNEINIIVYKKDLDKIEEIKTIYEIELKRKYGIIKIEENLKINKYLIIFLIMGLIIIYILSNVIFSVEVIHSDSNFRKFIKEELKKYDIDKYKIKKTYKEKEKIKEALLNKYKDKIEWLEIEEYGTKYRIRVEERKINKDKSDNLKKHVIAKKNGIIISVDAESGEVIKHKNDYVKKGDVIISGNISLNDKIINQTNALGTVYAEVWYTTKIKFPYHYKKITKTENKKTIFTIKFLNKYYDLFNFKKYKTKQIKNNYIIKNSMIPISLIKQEQFETIEIDKKYNKKEALNEAIKLGEKELLKKLDKNSKVLNKRILDKKENENDIELKIFFAVKENITDYKMVEEVELKES